MPKRKVQYSKRSAFWPCGDCRMNCSKDCIECNSCKTWYHYSCQKLSQEDVKSLEGPAPFTCFSCMREEQGGTYSFLATLLRLMTVKILSMNTHRRVGPTVSDAQITSEQRLSRIRTLRIFGGLHIGLGLVCGILSVVGTILSVGEKNRQCDYNNYYGYFHGYYSYYNSYYGYYYYCPRQYYSMLSFIMYIVSAAFSGWFILTGLFPFCMTLNRESSWKCLKTAFLVCCIISAAVFGFTVFILSVIIGIVNGAEDNSPVVTVSICLAVFGFVELIVAIVAASYSCCCSQLYTSQVAVFMSATHYGMQHNMQQSQMQSGYQQAYAPNWTTDAQHMSQEHQTPVFPHTEPNVPPQGTNLHSVPSDVPVTQQPIPQQYQAPGLAGTTKE